MAYYVLGCIGQYPSASIEGCPDLPGAAWFNGQKVKTEVPQPMRFSLDANRPGNLAALYPSMAYPLIRDDLLDCLLAAGVDNLQLFDAVIQDPATGEEHTNFMAFNVIGVVSAADMDESVLMGTSDSEMIDVDFESLAIDEERAAPFKLFRLAESVNAIIIDESVKTEIEKAQIPGMVFYDPENWSG